jgi:hypothetical protein
MNQTELASARRKAIANNSSKPLSGILCTLDEEVIAAAAKRLPDACRARDPYRAIEVAIDGNRRAIIHFKRTQQLCSLRYWWSPYKAESLD